MGSTITEKILAKAAGKRFVKAGDLVDASIDVIMCHDVTTPPAISMLQDKGIDTVFDAEKIVVTPDHFQPAKDIKSAANTITKSAKLVSVMRCCRSRVIFGLAR